jgi:CRISPR/Cas system-associated exonuclease Cas4 (RecB family)
MKYAPYSFSKIKTFFECQKKFDFTYVNKIDIDKDYTDPRYFVRGRFLHSYIAERLKGGDGLDMGSYKIEEEEKMNLVNVAENALENEYIGLTFTYDFNRVERQIFLGPELEPFEKKAGCAMTGYVDYYAFKDDFGAIVDWKTGKFRKDPCFSQLKLYAIWLFQKQPQLTEIDLVFYYVEHEELVVKTVTKMDIVDMMEELTTKIDTIENTTEFEINETKFCSDCQFYNTCIEEFGIGLLKS